MMIRRLAAAVAALLLLAASVGAASAETRRALVIGNDRYEEIAPLAKAVNDARAVASALERLDFAVSLHTDLGERATARAISAFARSLGPGDTAFFFYAGHGVEIDGENHLLPVDIPQPRPGEKALIKRESIPLSEVLRDLRASGANLTLAVIDACRDNPFASYDRSLGRTRGLAMAVPPEGTFIIYSAGLDQTALDRLSDQDRDPNSVFTRKLIPLMQEPGLSLPQLARRLRREVRELAATVNHPQRPAYYDEMLGDFAFKAAAAPPPPPKPEPAAPPPPNDEDPNAAELFDRGLAAHERADYAEAMRWYRQAAERGDVDAMIGIGFMFLAGDGVAKDTAEAVRWFRSASQTGSTEAMITIGLLFEGSNGVAQDYAEAMRWYRQAAENGSAFAMNRIGGLYNHGLGVPEDGAAAARWYARALANGDGVTRWELTESSDLFSRETWRELQRIFRQAGVYSGAIDGIPGPATRAAVNAYFEAGTR